MILTKYSSTTPYQPQAQQSKTLIALSKERNTPGEVQIAELVSQGKTNATIGTELWITENSVKQALKRMFLKLKVSSRVQMVAQLSLSLRM